MSKYAVLAGKLAFDPYAANGPCLYPTIGYNKRMATRVELSRVVEKALKKLPQQIVETDDLAAIRKIPGYHDEPLQGQRAGQRSVRLNRAYRVIYLVVAGEVQIVRVLDVNKHKY
jgi:toxin HigB-1